MNAVEKRIETILALELAAQIKALLPLIEMLTPLWVSGWANDQNDNPLVSAIGLLDAVGSKQTVDGRSLAATAKACLKALAELGEEVHNLEEAELAPPSMAMGLAAMLLAKAAQEAGRKVALPIGASLEGALRDGIPHLLNVAADPRAIRRSLGVSKRSS